MKKSHLTPDDLLEKVIHRFDLEGCERDILTSCVNFLPIEDREKFLERALRSVRGFIDEFLNKRIEEMGERVRVSKRREKHSEHYTLKSSSSSKALVFSLLLQRLSDLEDTERERVCVEKFGYTRDLSASLLELKQDKIQLYQGYLDFIEKSDQTTIEIFVDDLFWSEEVPRIFAKRAFPFFDAPFGVRGKCKTIKGKQFTYYANIEGKDSLLCAVLCATSKKFRGMTLGAIPIFLVKIRSLLSNFVKENRELYEEKSRKKSEEQFERAITYLANKEITLNWLWVVEEVLKTSVDIVNFNSEGEVIRKGGGKGKKVTLLSCSTAKYVAVCVRKKN